MINPQLANYLNSCTVETIDIPKPALPLIEKIVAINEQIVAMNAELLKHLSVMPVYKVSCK